LIAIPFLLGCVGGFLSLLHGGNLPVEMPRWMKNVLWATPFGLAVGIIISPLMGTIAFALCLLKSVGHGRGISLPYPLSGKPEKIEIFISWTQKYISTYQYKLLILAVTGALSVSGGLLMGGWPGFVILIGGLLKALAYLIGWKIIPQEKNDAFTFLNEATKWGEFLTGFFAYAALGIACLIA